MSEIKFGDLPAYTVKLSSGASVSVCLYGGTVYSYVDASGKERLFVSELAKKDGSKPIRGGIPLVFPQFNAGRLPNHGFARTSNWKLVSSESSGDKGSIVLSLTSADVAEQISSEKLKEWTWADKTWELVVEVEFSDYNFKSSLTVKNTGDKLFRFQLLQHTYYSLDGVENPAHVDGLSGEKYLDQLKPMHERLQFQTGPVVVDKNVDWIYKPKNNDGKIIVRSAEGNAEVAIEISLSHNGKDELCDAVVWNPWVDKAKGMSDFGDEEYKKMICVEPGCVSRYEECSAGDSWTLTQQAIFDKTELSNL